MTIRSKSTLAVASLLGLIAVGIGIAIAAPSPAKAPAIAPAQQQVAAPTVNDISKAFTDKGVVSCADRITQVTNFIGTGGNTGAFLFLPADPADKRIASASMEVVDKDKKSVYASASFASGQANGCGAVYDAIAWWQAKCDAVASSQFPGQKAAGKIKQNITILEINATTRVFLMPTTDGCISIKKEVVSQ